jgi:predicted transcriptional regulator
MTTKTEERRHVNVWVEPELARKLDERAEQEDRSRSAVIRVALRRHLERDDEKEEEANV